MTMSACTFGLLAALALGPPAPVSPASDEAFPTSSALAEGVSPAALAKVSRLVQTLADEEEIVGAELLVIKNGHSILHEAYGWRDREAKEPMETDSVFCVRSMTKPLIGAAILMLVDEDRLELDDRVAQYLPAFDVEGTRDITVEELLTHTSGLPMSLILGKNLHDLDGIQAVAALGGGCALEFEPGSAFAYSDQGADTLTALIEVITGAPAADFVRTRLLEPLGMRDSRCVLTEADPLRARAGTAYAGTRGEWTRFWGPDDPPLFPFFLGSQGLYSTTRDYARFMEFWRRKGRTVKERLLRARYVRKALTPGPYPMNGPTGFPGLRTEYGFLMQLWTGPEAPAAGSKTEGAGEREVVVFGHTGSDGTHAWVFPHQNAMVLYFTQSRNNLTGLRVEEALGELFLGVPFDPNQAAPPFEEYLGYYWEGEGDLYRAIIRDGEDLALEIRGRAIVPPTYVGEDRWKLRPDPSTVLAFDRAETGVVTGYHIGDHAEYRFEPSAALPSADEIAERVANAHRLDRLESRGPIRMTGELTIEKLGLTAETNTLLAWPDRFRVDSATPDESEHLAFDGEQIRLASSSRPLTVLEGPRAAALRRDSPLARFGDWPRWYPRRQVIQRIEKNGEEILVVRGGDTSAPAPTLYVHAATGRVIHEDSMTYADPLGRIGRRMNFGDFREVSGMLLPFRTETELANPLIGTIVTTVTKVEVGVELPEGVFALGE